MTTQCPKCGGTNIRITMWDGARSGGSRITCGTCGHVLEKKEYHADDNEITPWPPETKKNLSWTEKKASRTY